MNHATYRYISQCHGVAGSNRCRGTAHQCVPGRYALGRDNVPPLPIRVLKQGDVSGSIWIVFQTLYRCWYAIFAAFPVKDSIMLLVAATAVPRRYAPRIVASAGL